MPARLELEEPRDLLDVLTTALRLWVRHLPVFLTLAVLVVVPAQAALFAADADDAGTLATIAVLVTQLLVVPALVTAMHVAAVQDLDAGRAPSIRRSLAVVGHVGLPAIVVVALYSLGVTVGSALLIAPGLFLAVHWYFGAQAVVVEDRRGYGALRRSGELVGWRWGRVFAALIVLGALTALLATGLRYLLDQIAGDSDAAQLAEMIVAQTVAVSFTALGGTLLFFDLRARRRGDDGA